MGDPTLPTVREIVLQAARGSTDQTQYTLGGIQGARVLDMADYPPTLGALVRVVTFKATRAITIANAGSSAETRVFDLTHGVLVAGTVLSTPGTALVELSSGPLVVGAANGNVRDDGPTLYDVELRLDGPVAPGAHALLLGARFEIRYV